MSVLSSQNQPTHAAIVIYDGECGFCNKAVQFILKHERFPDLKFCAKQSPHAREILAQRSFDRDRLDSIALVEEHGIFLYSDASLRLASYLRSPWSWLRFGLFVPRAIRDPIYKLIAKYRRRLGSAGSCQVETRYQQPGRFLS